MRSEATQKLVRFIPIRLDLGTVVNIKGKRYTVKSVSKKAKIYRHTLEMSTI